MVVIIIINSTVPVVDLIMVECTVEDLIMVLDTEPMDLLDMVVLHHLVLLPLGNMAIHHNHKDVEQRQDIVSYNY